MPNETYIYVEETKTTTTQRTTHMCQHTVGRHMIASHSLASDKCPPS